MGALEQEIKTAEENFTVKELAPTPQEKEEIGVEGFEFKKKMRRLYQKLKKVKAKVQGPIRDIGETSEKEEPEEAFVTLKSGEWNQALEEYDQWKRRIFFDYTATLLMSYFDMWDSIAKDTVNPKSTSVQKGVHTVSNVGQTVSSLAGPFAIIPKVVLSVGDAVTDTVFLNLARQYAQNVSKLYNNNEFPTAEGRYRLEYKRKAALAEQVAALMSHRFHEQIILLSPESLRNLASLSIIPMIDYAVENDDKDFLRSELILLGSTQKPGNYERLLRSDSRFFVSNTALNLYNGQKWDAWDLLRYTGILTSENETLIPQKAEDKRFVQMLKGQKLFYYRHADKKEAEKLKYVKEQSSPIPEETIKERSRALKAFKEKFARFVQGTLDHSDLLELVAKGTFGLAAPKN